MCDFYSSDGIRVNSYVMREGIGNLNCFFILKIICATERYQTFFWSLSDPLDIERVDNRAHVAAKKLDSAVVPVSRKSRSPLPFLWWRQQRKRHVKREFVFLQSWWRLFLSNVGELSWSSIPKNHIQVEKGKQNFVVYLIVFSIKRDVRDVHVVVVQWRQGHVRRSVLLMHIVVLIIKRIAFLTYYELSISIPIPGLFSFAVLIFQVWQFSVNFKIVGGFISDLSSLLFG